MALTTMQSIAFGDLLNLTHKQGFIVTFRDPSCTPCEKLEDNLRKLKEAEIYPVYSINYDTLSPAERSNLNFISIPATFFVPKDSTFIGSVKQNTVIPVIGGNLQSLLNRFADFAERKNIALNNLEKTSNIFETGLTISSNSGPYGDLAQTNSFDGLACVPTAVANAFKGLDLDGLISNSQGSQTPLRVTRDELAKDYFYTSGYWNNQIKGHKNFARSNDPELADYTVPPGSPASLVIQGTLDYIKSKNLSHKLTVSALGLISGIVEVPEQESELKFNFTAFDLTVNKPELINKEKPIYSTPKLSDYEKYFQPIQAGDSKGVLDFLMHGLLRGPVVFGMFYTNEVGGHALTATEILLDDRNANGIIEYGEGILSFIDPLDPSQNYSPNVNNAITNSQFTNLESVGPPKIQQGLIWQEVDKNGDPKGFLRFYYNQSSLAISEEKLSLKGGDSSNDRAVESISTQPVYANITLAMGINTSGLAPDFDQRAGALSDTPGLLDFSFLLDDPSSLSQELVGYVYSNESSAYSNDFWYYECVNPEGLIEFMDPLTGQTSQLRPGDDGYNEMALDLAQEFSSGGAATLGIRQSNNYEVLTPFNLKLSELKTGYIAPISLTSEGDIWSPFSSANSDKLEHYLSTGPLSWRMEDMKGLGDGDFNDLHVSVLIQSISNESAPL